MRLSHLVVIVFIKVFVQQPANATRPTVEARIESRSDGESKAGESEARALSKAEDSESDDEGAIDSVKHGKPGWGPDGRPSDYQSNNRKRRRNLNCLSALATVWVVPCDKSAQAVPKPAQEVVVGECILDAQDAVTQVYFKSIYGTSAVEEIVELELQHDNRNLSPGQRAAVNLTAQHLVPTADGRMVPAGYLKPGMEAGGGVVKKLRVHTSKQVATFYTLSGSLLAGSEAADHSRCHDATACGVEVSSYDHWTDPYTSMDTRILFNLFGGSVVNSKLYQAYFWLESSLLDEWMHKLWPMELESLNLEALTV
mmetsp:Transcript_83015/g.146654  ORF Transcript_83015/g.146654 Transcript_83015/m.146654 type:complete len:312 (-) Transcript_83015:110-1045(-)